MEILTPYRIVKSKDESVTSGDVMWLSENLDLNSLNEHGWLSNGESNLDLLEYDPAEYYEITVIGRSEYIKKKK